MGANDDLVPEWDRLAISDDFHSEAERAMPQTAERLPEPSIGAASARQSTLSLADVSSSGIEIDSYEAIAIVEALCHSFITAGDTRGPADLDASRVFIHASGAVTAASDGRRDANLAIQSVGRMLSEILPETDFMFLRERVVSRAIASPPYYSSLEDFLRALEYYARPNRAELVQAVFVRATDALKAATEPEAKPVPPRPTPPLLVTRPRQTQKRWEEWWQDRRVRNGLAGVAIALLVGIVWLTVRHTIVPRAAALTPAPTSAAPPAAETAIAAATPAPAETAPTPEPAAAPTATPPPTGTPSVAASTPPPSVVAKRSASPPTRPSTRANQVVTPPISALPPILKLPMPAVVFAPAAMPLLDERVTAPVAKTSAETVARTPATYDATNSQVVPPHVMYPQSLDLLPIGSDRSSHVIEVVVSERGLVESAKSVRQPNTIGEYASVINGLSITKTWRFQPARLNGEPVKYRLFISLAK
jgi:hypothetical protein